MEKLSHVNSDPAQSAASTLLSHTLLYHPGWASNLTSHHHPCHCHGSACGLVGVFLKVVKCSFLRWSGSYCSKGLLYLIAYFRTDRWCNGITKLVFLCSEHCTGVGKVWWVETAHFYFVIWLPW